MLSAATDGQFIAATNRELAELRQIRAIWQHRLLHCDTHQTADCSAVAPYMATDTVTIAAPSRKNPDGYCPNSGMAPSTVNTTCIQDAS